MAIQKFDGLLIGKGDILSNTTSSRHLSGTMAMAAWSSSTTYIVDALVELSGSYYRSLQASNTNNNPGSSPTYWEKLSGTVKDGDVVYVTNGILSDIMVRNNTRWVSLIGIPITTVLSDNLAGQVMIQIPLSVARGATIEFSIQRNAAERRGTIRYQSDGSVVILSDSNNVDVGTGDVGVTFGGQLDGPMTNVQVTADTDSQGAPAVVKYVLRGWA